MPVSPLHLNIVTALECEARPVAERLGLQKVAEKTQRPVYLGGDIAMIVSGIGRRAAEVAVKYLHLSEEFQIVARNHDKAPSPSDAAWLNIGIGGHREFPVGQGVLAHRVEDAGWSRAWYPRIVFDPPCPTATVRTVDGVENAYFDPVVYEMEAAGFTAQASKVTSAELVHVYKIISDGPDAPTERITQAFVEDLVRARLDEIVEITEALRALASELAGAKAPPPGMQNLLEQWRFTKTQEFQLRRLLLRWQALKPEASPLETVREARHAREALYLLEGVLRAPPSSPGRKGGAA